MIELYAPTMIDGNMYICEKIEDGYAYLQKPSGRGRPKKVEVNQCPYFENNELIVPEKIKKKKRREAKNINMMKIFKDTVSEYSEDVGNFSVGRTVVFYLEDLLENFITLSAMYAVDNAQSEGKSRIMPRHVYWPSLNKYEAQHINPDADDWALHLRDTYYAKE